MKAEIKCGRLTIEDICSACSGELFLSGTSADAEVSAICTDSREAEEKTLFAAIRGERVDGHDYVSKNLERGCPFALVSRMPKGIEGKKYALVLVPDTVEALGKIAQSYKSRFDISTVGITGSVGKTTTKEFVSAVLSAGFKTFRTEGNYNSTIGMPLSIMEIDEGTEAAVLEMGMSGFGEISSMSRTARPDIAIITTIGTSHMEMLGSRENICRAKLEIKDGLSEDGILLINGDEPLLIGAELPGVRTVSVALENRDADVRALNIRMGISKTVFDIVCGDRVYPDIELPVMGRHYVYAALFAFVCGKRLEMDVEAIRRGLLSYKNVGMRQNIYELSGITVIEDCYNASPESMRSSIDVLSELAEKKGGRAVALLGDMLELGESSPILHREVGAYLARSGCRVLFTYGERAQNIAIAAVEGGVRAENVYTNPDLSAPALTGDMMLHALRKGDVVLFKASRSVAAERVIEYLKENSDKLPM